ncbi:hypothetical protein RIF25_07665 [Thermosynechococcaceae cyanobacterium BACA0444]|uniref:Uncharacterized protein n=1 Tax=Pseudocalidococcus azoricus BACA0444 TaxID=2918990 RepID=A0AAE4FR07_9CYAN|nr:hypothetical protein [Pseudocalidococcus azoricus]MDS3860688.1 hypothetical protein [Pseudocalidococcus azoricus BACA0444]
MTAESTPKRTKPKSSSGAPEIISIKKTVSPPPPPPPLSSPDPTPPPPPSPESTVTRLHPIPAVSERLQYRAIGLVKGIYKPDPDQFNRGILLTSDGQEIETVLLGQVMNLIKKYLDLNEEHLWVVYPRTRDLAREKKKEIRKDSRRSSQPQAPSPEDIILHLQIVGVWEPDILQQDSPVATESVVASVESDDGYFSIRGEVIFNSQDKKFVMVKIQQQPRKNADKGKAFKVRLEGVVEMKSPGYFWDLHAQRQGNRLVIQEANPVGVLPPRKAPKSARPAQPPFRKRTSGHPTSTTPERHSLPPRPIRRTPSNPSS